MARGKFDVKKIVALYAKRLIENGINPEKIILYGSYARGTSDEWSDIDLVVISEDLKRWPALKRLEELSVLTSHIDAPLEVLGYTPDDIARRGKDSIIWDEIKRTGKVVYSS